MISYSYIWYLDQTQQTIMQNRESVLKIMTIYYIYFNFIQKHEWSYQRIKLHWKIRNPIQNNENAFIYIRKHWLIKNLL